jgi:hypothetical protein
VVCDREGDDFVAEVLAGELQIDECFLGVVYSLLPMLQRSLMLVDDGIYRAKITMGCREVEIVFRKLHSEPDRLRQILHGRLVLARVPIYTGYVVVYIALLLKKLSLILSYKRNHLQPLQNQ